MPSNCRCFDWYYTADYDFDVEFKIYLAARRGSKLIRKRMLLGQLTQHFGVTGEQVRTKQACCGGDTFEYGVALSDLDGAFDQLASVTIELPGKIRELGTTGLSGAVVVFAGGEPGEPPSPVRIDHVAVKHDRPETADDEEDAARERFLAVAESKVDEHLAARLLKISPHHNVQAKQPSSSAGKKAQAKKGPRKKPSRTASRTRK